MKNLESYNKSTSHKTHGTLVGNWHEEAILKEETGQSRLTYPKHMKKSHKELFDETKISDPTVSNPSTHSTSQRIFGESSGMNFKSFNSEYGKSENPAEKLPQVGRKHLLLQKQVYSP